MINIPKSAQVAKGDSIVTSGYSLSFPPDILIGTVADVVNDKASNFYSLQIRPATNFYNLEYVNVVDNLQKEEQKTVEEAARRNQ
jgi:rod shape-determining protein MreC